MTNSIQQVFRPSVLSTIVLALLATLFANLGLWQTNRGAEKFELEHQFANADIMPLADALEQEQRFATVNTLGNYDTRRHILLDNQIYKGRSGVHVYTPFYAEDGTTILVNRGWLPLAADRNNLPVVPTPETNLIVSGRLNNFPVPGRSLGEADQLKNNQWPQLVTYLKQPDIATALGIDISPWVVQLAADDKSGFEDRDWKPVFLNSEKHGAYAFQWYAMAFITVVLWLAGGIRRAKGNRS